MKKLFILQSITSAAAYLAGRRLRVPFLWIVLLAWIPIFLAGYIFLWWFRNVFFYRDPSRAIPPGDDVVVSPADGRVMYVRSVKAGEIVSEKTGQKIRVSELAKTTLGISDGWLVGIYMTPFDVHFNRAPIGGKITTVYHHRTGVNLPMVDLWEYVRFTVLRKAVDMFAAPFHLENERLTLQIQNERATCFLILIADRFVNKISPLYSEQQTVSKGEKITFIERGSQTDLFLPSGGITLRVRPGDQVYAGETVLGTVQE